MADNDGDSHMASTPDISDPEDILVDPSTALLSPPETQQPSGAPVPPPGANANGKRPLNTISSGADGEDAPAPAALGGSGAHPPKTHASSGYTWTRAEDGPGHLWLSKKALDERNRAWDGVAHKEFGVQSM